MITYSTLCALTQQFIDENQLALELDLNAFVDDFFTRMDHEIRYMQHMESHCGLDISGQVRTSDEYFSDFFENILILQSETLTGELRSLPGARVTAPVFYPG